MFFKKLHKNLRNKIFNGGELKPEVEDLIIQTAYRDVDIFNMLRIYFYAQLFEEVKEKLKNAADVKMIIHKIPKMECPEYIVEKARKTTNIKRKIELFQFIYNLFMGKPLVSFSAVVLILAAVSFAVLKENQQNEVQYSSAEIHLANKQAKEAFMLISKVLNKTKKSIKEEVFIQRVGKPINKGMNKVTELFNGAS